MRFPVLSSTRPSRGMLAAVCVLLSIVTCFPARTVPEWARTVLKWDGVALAAEGGGTAGEDTVTAEVRDGSHREGSACRWRPVTAVDPHSGSNRELPVTRTVGSEHETLYQRNCPRDADSWYQWVRDSTAARVTARASDTAMQKVSRLVFRTAPPADRNVVNVGTWFWVPRLAWRRVSATAYIVLPYGVFTVTVTATPHRLRFDPGDGSDAVWCTGPGRPWVPALGDRAESNCMHTYRHASDSRPDGRFAARTSVEWLVDVSSNFGIAFPLPPIRTGLATPVTVRELQAVLSS
ncbi:MAG: hypothetical protein RLZZ305_663 [Actinomycetota bacterium]